MFNPSRRYNSSIAKAAAILMAGDRRVIVLFLVVAVLGALTEGIGLGLVAPLLEAQGNQRMFADIPVLGEFGDYLAHYAPDDRLKITAIILAGAVVFRALLHGVTLFLARYLPATIQRQIAANNHAMLTDANIAFVNSSRAGDLVNTLQSIPVRVANAAFSIATMIWNFILLIILLALMYVVSATYLMYSAVFVLAFSLLYIWVTSGPLFRASKNMTEANQNRFQNNLESINGFSFIKLLSAEPEIRARNNNILDELVRLSILTNFLNALPQPLLMMSAGLFVAGTLFFISMETGNISEQLGHLILFLAILMRLMGPVSSINSMRASIRSQVNAIEVQEKFVDDISRYQSRKDGAAISEIADTIKFDHVKFSYPNESGVALQDVRFDIKCGNMVAIVGHSGAGKSTIISLLTGLRQPDAGRILVDGQDLNNIDLRSWRRQISVVSQDIFVFNDSIRNNLKFGLGDISEERINTALRDASADEFIEQMEAGLDTLVGDRGARLSGGQRQRLAIARAFLADPRLLILDEATNQLDSITERAIQNSLNKLRQNRTLLVVAHRLSTVQMADQIIVLDKGDVVEHGTHTELLAKNGQYAALIENQRLDLTAENGRPEPQLSK